MTCSPERKRNVLKAEIGLFLILLAGGLVLIWCMTEGEPQVGDEAVIRVGVGRDLLAGLPRGRQGLVGSLRWAPLPTLAVLPLLRLPAPFGGDGSPIVVAVISAALLCALLSAWLGRCGMGKVLRLTVSLAIFLSPVMQHALVAGSAGPLFLLMAVAALCFLLHWWQTGQLRSLAYMALCLSLALIARYQAVALLTMSAVAVAFHLFAARKPAKHYAEATAIVFLVPSLYVILLWIASNWLIMGDALFFMRGLTHVGASLATLVQGCEWARVLVLATLVILPWVVRGRRRVVRTGWSALVIVGVCVAFGYGPQSASLPMSNLPNTEIAQVTAQLITRHPNDWIVYSGYRGYPLSRALGSETGPYLHHTLSFYTAPVLESTRGKRAYILTRASDHGGAWEDMNIKHPGLFEHGASFTVFEAEWDHWRLWRMVRNDPTDRR